MQSWQLLSHQEGEEPWLHGSHSQIERSCHIPNSGIPAPQIACTRMLLLGHCSELDIGFGHVNKWPLIGGLPDTSHKTICRPVRFVNRPSWSSHIVQLCFSFSCHVKYNCCLEHNSNSTIEVANCNVWVLELCTLSYKCHEPHATGQEPDAKTFVVWTFFANDQIRSCRTKTSVEKGRDWHERLKDFMPGSGVCLLPRDCGLFWWPGTYRDPDVLEGDDWSSHCSPSSLFLSSWDMLLLVDEPRASFRDLVFLTFASGK